MKTNITLFVAFLFLGTTLGFSQNEEECNQTLSIMTEYVKAKNYKAAYEPFKKLRTECAKYNPGAQFKYGEDMFEHEHIQIEQRGQPQPSQW